jgi:probable rRNA maturation factor
MKTDPVQAIHFHYLVEPFFFPRRRPLKAFLARQLVSAGKEIETINYIFCEDDYLLKVNQDYLNHNYFTDIITFELSSKAQPLLSDIYISIDRIKENASHYTSSFKSELHRVIFHGALHLLGYKDKTDRDAKTMREKEDEWLAAYFVPREIPNSKKINRFPVKR